MKPSLIFKEAKEVRSFIEQNKKLPSYCTIDGNQYSIYTTSYLFGKLLANLKATDIKVITIQNANKTYNGTINEKVLSSDYLDMNKRFVSYCEANKMVPAYVTTRKSKTKVDFSLFVYCLTKILVFYSNNSNTLPNYCEFKSTDLKNASSNASSQKKTTSTSTSSAIKTTTKVNHCQNPYTSTPHYTSQGCNKLGQCTGYYCGPHAIHQAMRKFGISKYTEKQIAGWAGTSTAGTDHNGINTAIAKISKLTGKKISVQWKNYSDMGNTDSEKFANIAKILCKDNKAIIWHIAYHNGGVDASGKAFGHYEYLDKINTSTKYVRALNSLGSKKNDGSYLGKLQDRPYNVQATYAKTTPGGQPALCIITLG